MAFSLRRAKTTGKRLKRPLLLDARSSRWFITTVVAFTGGVDIFMYGMISPVTPTALHERVGLPNSKVQTWTSILLSLFAASLLFTSPIVGLVSDRSGSHRWPYLIGLLGIAVATALLCIGTHLALWIVGRLAQGIAAAVVWVIGVALVVDTGGKDGLMESMGYMSMAMSLGTIGGPLLGGVVYENGGYYSVYGLAFGLIAIDALLRLSLIEKKERLEWSGTEASESEQTSGIEQLQATQKATICSAHNILRGQTTTTTGSNGKSKAKPNAIKQFTMLLKSRRLLVTVWANFILSMIMTSFDSVLPIFVHETFGWRQSGQGLIFLPLMVPHIASPLTGAMMDRSPQYARYFASGAFVAAVPPLVLLRLITDNSLGHKVLLCCLLGLMGGSAAVALPPIDAEAFLAVSAMEAATPEVFGPGGAMASAFGISTMGFGLGALIGPFFAGFIRENAGWGTMGWALGLLSGISSIPLLLFLGGWILDSRAVSNDQPPADVDPGYAEEHTA